MRSRHMTDYGLVLGLLWACPFLGCNLLVSNAPVNDNSDDNTNENANDNTNGNDNVEDNANDNDGGTTTNFAVFDDPGSDFSTTDVRDVDEEIVRFDTQTNGIFNLADGATYNTGSWPTNGLFLGSGGFYQVDFGTKEGERRAYFIETASATICNLVVQGGQILIFPTTTPVPQE